MVADESMKTNSVQDGIAIQKLATSLGGGRQRQCLKLVFPAELRLSQTQVRLESKSDSSRLEFSERCNSAQLSKTTASEMYCQPHRVHRVLALSAF
jgi:hypothetical protein